MYDVVIIGAGIIGTFLARELSRYECRVALLEKADDVACGATMANSAIIHAGHDPKPGTLKARFNVRGNAMYEEICRELGCGFKRCSALVAATSKEEEKTLEALYQQAVERHVPVRELCREEALALEPHLSDLVTKALELPSTGIITPWEVAIALAEEAVLNGGELFLEHEVTAIRREGESFLVIAQTGEGQERTLKTRRVIDAAGVYADAIYGMVSEKQRSVEPLFTITPRKGEYYVVDHEEEPLVERVIYPVPTKKGKGVLVVPTLHGNLLIGPNAEAVSDREDVSSTAEGLAYVKEQAARTVKELPFGKVIRNFSGLRPSGSTHDFIVQEAEDVPGFFLAAAIESPGLSAAPAIAEYVVHTLLEPQMELREKEVYHHRKPFLSLKGMTGEEYNGKIRENPAFGRMVCRCEQITEGEILDVIHRPVGARTLKGVKKRCRPGMGRCQGGFCEPLITELLSRELQVTPEKLLEIPEEEGRA